MPAVEMDGCAVQLDAVSKRFREETALDRLTLGVPRGGALGLIGPNGAGKTTSIRLAMGLMRPDRGRVRVFGLDPVADGVAVHGCVGYVPEQPFIHRWMRGCEAVAYCRAFYTDWNDRLCHHLARMFRLDMNKMVKHMSKGMVTKLSLLLAMSHEPDLLLLDEPMAGLDPLIREELLEGVLQGLCDRKQAIVISSHSLADVQRLADTVALVYEGRLLEHSPVDALLTRTKRIRAVLRNGAKPSAIPDGAIWQRVQNREWLVTIKNCTPQVVERLRSANDVENVEVVDLGLEEIFKDYVKGRSQGP